MILPKLGPARVGGRKQTLAKREFKTMEKSSFYIIAAALAVAVFAHGASHPQASQDWVRAFVSNQMQRAGSGAGGCGCSSGSAPAQGDGCGCGTGAAGAGCSSGCAGTDDQGIKNWVRMYVATNGAATLSIPPAASANSTIECRIGGYTIRREPPTVTGLVVRATTAQSEAAGLRDGRLLVMDPAPTGTWARAGSWMFRNGTPGSGNLPIYASTSNLYVCAEAGGAPVWTTSGGGASWLLAGGPHDEVTNRVCRLAKIFIQQSIADMALSTNGFHMIIVDGYYKVDEYYQNE